MLRAFSSLALLMIAAVGFCCVATMGSWVASHLRGLLALAATGVWLAMGCSLVLVLWAAAHAISPGPTKYLTVCGLIAGVFLSLLSMWILQAREVARRTSTINNLRMIGSEWAHHRDFRRDDGAPRQGPVAEPTLDPLPTGRSSAASHP